MERDPQLLKYPLCSSKRRLRFRPARACYDPIVGISGQPIAFLPHLPIKRSQKDVAEEWRNDSSLRCSLFCRERFTLGVASGLQDALDNLEHPPVCYSLAHEE